MIKYPLINTKETLVNQCEDLKKQNKIAIDLEADSMHHFKEKVCLVQIADLNGPFLVDPLNINDMSPLKPVLEDYKIVKIFHGSDFDIRSLDRDFHIKINNLFDTEIACRFLGIQKRSLAALLKKYFKLSVDKSFQKIDWSIRPLSKDMISYGITDVAYLIELYEILKKRLEDAGRLLWAEEEFEIQTRVRYENNGKNPLFMKFKGAGKMGRRSLAVLENLLLMRKEIALRKDRPLFKVLSAESINKMAWDLPESMGQLQRTRALGPRQMKIFGENCIKAIVKGLEMEEKDLPLYPREKTPRFSPEIPERIKALKLMRVHASKSTGIEPGFLLNNATISAVANAFPKSIQELKNINVLRLWQVEILGDDILKALGV